MTKSCEIASDAFSRRIFKSELCCIIVPWRRFCLRSLSDFCVFRAFSAKKRLRTMLKNPTKKANANALVAHLALIQRYSKEDEERKPIYNPVVGDFVKVDVPDNVDETTMRKIKPLDDQQQQVVVDANDDAADDPEQDVATILNLGFEGLSQDDKLTVQL